MDAGLSREHGAEAAATLTAKRSLHQGFFAMQNRLNSIHALRHSYTSSFASQKSKCIHCLRCLTGSAGRDDHRLSNVLLDEITGTVTLEIGNY